MPSNTKFVTGALALCILWVAASSGQSIFGIEHALAQAPNNSIFTNMTTFMSTFLVIINTITFLIYPLLTVIVDPVFFVEIYNINGSVLHLLWQVSRNIMNVIFVFILIGVAVMTVITAKKDLIGKYAIKFVLAVILVNFSWFFPRVILDVGTIAAATVYKLPEIVQTECRYININGQSRPCEFAFDFRFFDRARPLYQNNLAEGAPAFYCPTSIACYRKVQLNNMTTHPRGVLSGLIMNHGRLPQLAQVQNFNAQVPARGNVLGNISFLLMFLANAVFGLALSVTLLLAMLAMLVAFIIRIPVLWLTISFMPFMFLGYVIGDMIPGQFNTMKIFEHFVKAAFLPAVIAIPITVGFLILNVMSTATVPMNANMLLNAVGNVIPGINNLWTLLWMITTVIVIWRGTFMALSLDPIYERATEGIKGFGGSLGTIVKNLPMNIPVLGVGRAGTTLGELKRQTQTLANTVQYGQLPDAIKDRMEKRNAAGGGGGGNRPPNLTRDQLTLQNTVILNAANQHNIDAALRNMQRDNFNPASFAQFNAAIGAVAAGNMNAANRNDVEAVIRARLAFFNGGRDITPAQLQALRDALRAQGIGRGRP